MKLSNIRKKMKELYLDIYFKIKPLKFVQGEKILLTTTDGLGDNIIREKLLEKFLKEYGSRNVIILCKDKVETFFKKLGYQNIIIYEDIYRKRVTGKIKLIEKVARLGINKIVSLEFDQHDIFVKYLKDLEKVGYLNSFHEEMNKYYNFKINFNKEEYILKQVQRFYQEYFKEKISLEEIIPNLKKMYNKNKKYENCIAFGIGSIDRKRILCPDKIVEFIKSLRKVTNKEIILLGKGNLEEELIKELEQKISFEKYNIIDLVNKISLEESLEIINSSEGYIGMESGLYNFAFVLGKKILAFFGEKNNFSHDTFERVIILYGKERKETNEKFGTSLLNSIVIDEESIKQFIYKKYQEKE